MTHLIKESKTSDGVRLLTAKIPGFGSINYRPVSKTKDKLPTVQIAIPEFQNMINKIKFR